MIRWLAVAAAIVGSVTIALVQLEGAMEIVAWEALLFAAAIVLTRRRWPSPPSRPGSLFGSLPSAPSRRPRSLAVIEMEVASALDPALGGARQLRRRLRSLARHRAGVAGDDDLMGAVGEETWRILHDADDVVSAEEVHAAVARLELP